MDFACHLPLNSLSFGQCSTALLREIHIRGYQPAIFPIGNQVDLTTQRIDQEFANWLNACIGKSLKTHSRKTPVLKLWHLQGSLESVSDRQVLFTFYECDSPTREELNTARNNVKVIVSSRFAKGVFEDFGAKNIEYVPLGFDKYNFYKKEKQFFIDDRISFGVVGKFEKRKGHAKLIRAWKKKFGGSTKYFLNCAIWNQFVQPPEANHNIWGQIVENQKPVNIEFYGFMPTNEAYNDFLNSNDIIIGMSGGEGFGLPEFHSVALGKHAVILNAHSYKDWANEGNAVLVNPTGKFPAEDGMFFHKGAPYNQGNFFDFDADEFVAACEAAIQRVEANRLNEAGVRLQTEFSYSRTADEVLKIVKGV